MAAARTWKRPFVAPIQLPAEEEDFVRKKVKVSDLPITSAQRQAVDGLLHTFKKNGEFDKLRKDVYNQFAQSVSFLFICATTSNYEPLH
jgi:hypothetical protein